MRSSTPMSSPVSCIRPGSPPLRDVWSTERRLIEKPPPGAPGRTRPSSPSFYLGGATKRSRNHFIQPSRPITESDDDDERDSDEDSLAVSIHFRPSRLVFWEEESFDSNCETSHQVSPTVLLVPQTVMPWYEAESEGDDGDPDEDMSPRLFRTSGSQAHHVNRITRQSNSTTEDPMPDELQIDESRNIFRAREYQEEEEPEDRDVSQSYIGFFDDATDRM